MSFQALYRKYRSQTFGELVGQEPVATALRNAVREGRVGHAYLFTGPRGTGKTSTARILAKAVNCEQPGADGEPCNRCGSCVAITNGSSMDVLELDAASNNGVNEMRELLGRVAYRSAGGRWKVYIIDEVHMLSAAASNALLKTLEEPPEHVKFVLATTDPHKVLPTIRSRTQQFEFALLPTDKLAAHLAAVSTAEGVGVDPEALQLIARRAAGSARDALSLLDQAIAHGDGRVEADAVRELFEATVFDRQAALLDAVAAEDPGTALVLLGEILATGVDARALADDLLRYLRDVYVLAASRGAVRVDRLAEEQVRLQAQGEQLGAGSVQRAIETLGSAVADMTRAPDTRLVLEVAVVRLARRELGTQVEVLLDRIERLERTVDELRRGGLPSAPAAASPAAAAPAPAARAAVAEPPEPMAPTEPVPPPTEPLPSTTETLSAPHATVGLARPTIGALRRSEPPAVEAPSTEPDPAPAAAPDLAPSSPALELDTVVLRWPAVLERLEGRLRLAVNEMHPIRLEGTTVVVALSSASQRHQAVLDAGRDVVTQAMSGVLGAPLDIRAELSDVFVPRQPTAGERRPRRAAPAPEADAEPPPPADPGPDDDPDLIDPDELVDAPPDGAATVDSVARMIQLFDATVVEDRP